MYLEFYGFRLMMGSSLPGRGQDLGDKHSTFVAKGTDIKRFSGQRLIAGFPVEDIRMGLQRGSI